MLKKLIIVTSIFIATIVHADTFTIVVPSAPGSFQDTAARHAAEAISTTIDMPVVVDNRPGAGGLIAINHFMGLPRDGKSALLGSTNLPLIAKTHKDLGYNLLTDIVPIYSVSRAEVVLAVSSVSDIYTVKDLVNKHKTKILVSGSANANSEAILIQLNKSLGIKDNIIKYKQPTQLLIDVANNELDYTATAISSTGIIQLIAANKLRPIAVIGSERSKSLPQVPSLTELGYASTNDFMWSGIFMHINSPDNYKKLVAASEENLKDTSKYTGFVRYKVSVKSLKNQIKREYDLIKP